MKIKLLSHASVIIKTSDCKILTDPWFESSVFMNSWSLHPKPNINIEDFSEITHLFISHEHPDHFNIPTLKSFPNDFKKKVTILVQKNNSNRIPKALNSFLGFENIILCENNNKYEISNQTAVQINQFGIGPDSSLAVFNNNEVILNINDCELNSRDCKRLLKNLKKVDYVLNQFSIAGYRGNWDYDKKLRTDANQILDNMINNHKDLKAKVTIPFASFIYFSDTDNKYLNKYSNKISDVYNSFKKEKLNLKILYMGDETEIDKKYDSSAALEKFKSSDKAIDNLQYRENEKKNFEDLQKYFKTLIKNLEDRYPNWLIIICGDLIIYTKDLNLKILISFRKKKFEIVNNEDFDLEMSSEALEYALRFTWGFSTIGVGGKFLIKKKYNIWIFYKLITSLNNAGIYLKIKYLFTRNNYLFLKSRYKGIFNQIIYKISRNF